MTTLLPLVALAIAIAAFLGLEVKRPVDQTPYRLQGFVASAILFLVVLAFAWWKRDAYHGLWQAAWAFGLGLLVVAKSDGAEWWSRKTVGFNAVPMAMAVVASGALQWWKADLIPLAQMAAVAGAAFGAWILLASDDRRRGDALVCAALLAAIVCADSMGSIALSSDAGGRVGTAFGIFATLAAFLGGAQRALFPRSDLTKARATALVAFLASAWIVGMRYLNLADAWTIVGAAAVVGLVIHGLLPNSARGEAEGADSFRFLVAVVIGIGFATYAFSLRQGFGISLAALGCTATLTILGNRRALLAMGPLVWLAFYRLFRETHVDASRALDIGQHYALVGIAIGAIVPLLPIDWNGGRSALRNAIGSTLWAVLLGGIPIVVALFLGPKGTVGLIAGLGFTTVVAGLRNERSLLSFVLAAGIAAAAILTYGWVGDTMLMTHEDKVAILKKSVVFLVVLVIAIYATAPRSPESSSRVPDGEPA